MKYANFYLKDKSKAGDPMKTGWIGSACSTSEKDIKEMFSHIKKYSGFDKSEVVVKIQERRPFD